MVNMNHHKDPAVYALHAGDFLFRYVGSTSVNSQNRMYQHAYRARSGHGAQVYQWIRSVGIENVRVVDLIHETDPVMRNALEVCAIVQLADEGHPLVNSLWIKGDGDQVASNEYRRRVSAARAKPVRKPRPAQKPKLPSAPRVPQIRVPQHGTRHEYETYKCRCDPCRLVMAQRNAARRGKPIPQIAPRKRGETPEHGTARRYKHYGCRCDECRIALREQLRMRQAA